MPRVEQHLLAPLLLGLLLTHNLGAQPMRDRRIIDVHLHAGPGADTAGRVDPAAIDRRATSMLAIMDSLGIVRSVISGPFEPVARWRTIGADRFLAGPVFPCIDGLAPNGARARCSPTLSLFPDTAWLAAAVRRREFGVFGEIPAQLAGIAADDSRLEPYYALAEQLDIPIAIHLGPNVPGANYAGSCRQTACSAEYRLAAGSPRALEAVLLRHPRLRVSVMHAGWPLIDEMMQLLWAHPQVHVDLGYIAYAVPEPEFYRTLQRLVEAGFGARIMYGSDAGTSSTMRRAIDRIERAPFLSDSVRRAIFFDNAVRFFRFRDLEGR